VIKQTSYKLYNHNAQTANPRHSIWITVISQHQLMFIRGLTVDRLIWNSPRAFP